LAQASTTSTAEELRSEVDRILGRLIEPGADVALLNFPRFGNLGDAAIWLGESAALKRAGARIRYRCDPRTYRRRLLAAAVGDAGTIVLHGGGNLGDVYPLQQRVRVRVIRDFPEARIIQLPQTVWFRERELAGRFGELCRGHPDFTLLVRERASLERARELLGVESTLCPDGAFGLGPLEAPSDPQCDVLWLMRDDRERSVERPAPGTGSLLADWPDKFGAGTGARGRGLRRVLALNRLLSAPVERHSRASRLFARLAPASYQPLARRRVALALATLGRGRVIVTDRLHGHILATLAGVRHVVLDSASGKSGAVHETWTSASPISRFASSLDEAERLADALLSETGRAPASRA
jgi:pyruvyl transferase EpsO